MKNIYVVKPDLPPRKRFEKYLDQMWESGILTHNGPLHRELEQELEQWLGSGHISLFANGTLGLIVALKALDLSGGEVITSPYSFVATASAITAAGLIPVFADIAPDSPNLDPEAVERAITSRTVAIMPIHVYGIPCDVALFDHLAQKHNLRIIYDGAHAFGVRLSGRPLSDWGDLTMFSFHATKVFHTFEGGCLVSSSQEMKEKIDALIYYGMSDRLQADLLGFNAKMTEVSAAMGLCLLPDLDSRLKRRRELHNLYAADLNEVRGLELIGSHDERVTPNHAYLPLRISDGTQVRDRLDAFLRTRGIFCRKYFFPLLSDMPVYRSFAGDNHFPNADMLARQILCLPFYPSMNLDDIQRVCTAVREFFAQ